MSMHGKICLVTGATNGIGLVAARELARMGATVIVAGRSERKTADVVAEMRASSGSADIHPMIADLSLMSGVRSLADQFTARFARLDVLLNNAGGIFNQRTLTSEGLELTFALNHLSYFLLTHLLIEPLRASPSARVVNVSSNAHLSVRALDFDNLQGEKRYFGFSAYSISKLANVMFTYALARRLEGSSITSNALHPGAVSTGFGTNNKDALSQVMFRVFQMVTMSPEQGAQTSIYLASSPEVEGVSGKYFVKSRAVRSSPASCDVQAQERLWALSEQITGVTLPARAAV